MTMGCLKLAYIEPEKPFLRCVWRSEKPQKSGVKWYDYGARFYDPALGRFHTQDAFAEKYYEFSNYHYASNNPVLFIDVNGDSINAGQLDAQQMIMNTLNEEDAAYLQFDKNGNIDLGVLNSHTSESGNFSSLQEIANNESWMKISLDDKFSYKDNEGNIREKKMPHSSADPDFVDSDGSTLNGTTTGESGFMGATLLPGQGRSGLNSTDNSINIVINSKLSEPARAEIYSHEANGHALMYLRTGDRQQSGHMYREGLKDINTPLKNMIIKSKMETVRNMK